MTDDAKQLEVRYGRDYVKFKEGDLANRKAAIFFIVSKLDLHPQEVAAARSVLGLPSDDNATEQAQDSE